jgi:hypothetical protein
MSGILYGGSPPLSSIWSFMPWLTTLTLVAVVRHFQPHHFGGTVGTGTFGVCSADKAGPRPARDERAVNIARRPEPPEVHLDGTP